MLGLLAISEEDEEYIRDSMDIDVPACTAGEGVLMADVLSTMFFTLLSTYLVYGTRGRIVLYCNTRTYTL
jgi:hypothetical protein